MKRIRPIGLLAACLAAGMTLAECGGAACCRPTVQKPFATSPLHEPKLVMGRDYWTFLGSSPITDPAYFADAKAQEKALKNPWNNPALTNLPAFRDCGLVRSANQPPPATKDCTKASWRTVAESCGPVGRPSVMDTTVTNRPTVLVFGGKRNVLAMAGEIDLDYDDWAAYKKAHPNLICTRTMCEWGNDLLLNKSRTGNVLNPERRAELEAVWSRYKMDDRYQRLALCRWYTDRKLKLHYDDLETFMAFRGMFHLDHVAAAWGAKYLVHEQTNTSGGNGEYRWDISGIFCRGAARQFGLPWAWYEAAFFNGPAKDGSMHYNSVPRYRTAPRQPPRPQDGTSASAQRRMWYFAYVNGANAVESESWSGCFFTTNTPSGKAWLSPRGRNFTEFHDFTAAHPNRGVTYAPVAILTPFAQGYVSQGGRAWASCPYTDGDYALDAIFFSIAPGWERAKGLKAGIQDGNLHNSKFAMMYDVLVPDSPQPKEEFAKALFAYPAAILAGTYRDESQFADVLAAYEKAGGRLIRVTADDLPPLRKNPFDTIEAIRAGRLAFPQVEAKLAALQRDLFPFEVSGSCQYGANRTKTGWWLWAFNNRGVNKYADTFETIDRTKDSTLTVKLGSRSDGSGVKKVRELVSGKTVEVTGDSFSWTVPAGDLAIFEIGPAASRQPKVSVFAHFIRRVAKERGVSLAEAADFLYGLGIRGYDCGLWENDLDELAATRLKPINFYYFVREFGTEAGVATNALCLAKAKKYGIPRIMTIPPNFTEGGDREAEFARTLAGLKAFVAQAKAEGVTITVEDFGGTKNPCSYAKYLKRMLDEIPDLRFALDSGNLYYAGRGDDILDMMEFAKGRLGHIHLKDQPRENNRAYVTLGRGAVPNERIVRETWAAGYDGWYTLENPVGDVFDDTTRQMSVLKTWFGTK